MPPSKAQRAETAERRAALVRLRRAGVNFDDERILALGYASRQHATKDFYRLLKKRTSEEAAEVSLYRQESKERLLVLLASVWTAATDPVDPDLKAHEQARKIISDLDDLLGTKMPVKAELSGPDGGAIPFNSGELDELKTLIKFAADPSSPPPAIRNSDAADDEDEDLDDTDDDDENV